MASPAARVLHPSSAANAPAPVAALFGKAGRSPRVYAGRDVEALLQLMQVTAQKKFGVTLAGMRRQLTLESARVHCSTTSIVASPLSARCLKLIVWAGVTVLGLLVKTNWV